MDIKILHKIFATLSFLLAAIVYLMTVQPSVPFWDCGEFSSAATWQQVPHPPGAPLFLMLGRVFQIIIPFGDLGWRVNLAAVFSSAFSVLFAYLITVRMIKSFAGEPKSMGEALATFGSGFIAAAALTFSDTMWFNSVESEVYATSLTFVALITWLMMKWYENSDEPGHERWLILIAYLIGLSIGVHLLAILTLFSLALLIYFKKYKFSFVSFIVMGIITIVVFYLIYSGIVMAIPAFIAGHTPGRNQVQEYTINNSSFLTFFTLFVIASAIFGFFWGLKKDVQWMKIITSIFLFILLGYTTYTQILLRSHSNPPMNENEPKNFTLLSSYLGREQYGNAPSYPRRYQNDDMFIQYYVQKDSRGEYVYGEWYPPQTVPKTTNDGRTIGVPEFVQVNFSGEMAYMFKYQMNHMYWRYFGWNFIGRKSDVQDAGVAWFTGKDDPEVKSFNADSGYKDEFPIRFFALPFIIGLIGLYFQFKKDPRMAIVYLAMFLVMGILAALQQNQQNPQPRERDYFYAGSFMVWCLWIGLGCYYLIESLSKTKFTTLISGATLAGVFVLVPLNMGIGGWKIHSRAGNYLPFDFSYNILQSVEKDAIIFTNGDNDTFPVWWVQDVAGVRRDVRIVNLSLGNTLWYVDQLKNREPWGATKLPLTFSDESLRVDENSDNALSYDFGEAQRVNIPIRKEILAQFTSDSSIINSPTQTFLFGGKPYGEQGGKPISLFRVQDKLIYDIIKTTKFERPLYFSTTVGPDAFAGLDTYFRMEGLCMRICPVPQKQGSNESLNESVMEQCLMNIDNSDNYSKEPKYGFKLRNLNNMNVYYDEVARRLMNSYRSLYTTYAAYHLVKQNTQKAQEILNVLNKNISTTQFPISFDLAFRFARIYDDAGDKANSKKYAIDGIRLCEAMISNKDNDMYVNYEVTGRNIGPYNVSAMLHELMGNYKQAADILKSFTQEIQSRNSDISGDNRIMSAYFGALRDIKKYEVLQYNKEKGLDATEKYIMEQIQLLDQSPSQENQFYKQGYLEVLQELKSKSGSLPTDTAVNK